MKGPEEGMLCSPDTSILKYHLIKTACSGDKTAASHRETWGQSSLAVGCCLCRILTAIDWLITPPFFGVVLALDPESERDDSCRSRTAATVAQDSEGGRADQRESGRFRNRGGDADHLLRTQQRDARIKSGIDRVEKSIRDQTLSNGPGVESVGKEQVLRVVTRIDAVDLESADDIRPGPCDFGEKLVDVDKDDSVAVFRNEIPEAVVKL